MIKVWVSFAVAGLLLGQSAFADSPAPNSPKTFIDKQGFCLAHTVPGEEYYGNEGKTDVYLVGEALDLLDTYDWYSPEVFVACQIVYGHLVLSPILVMTGSWPRGREANEDELAIGFYQNGKLIREYSTLDIAAGDPENVRRSVSHYRVVDKYLGFRWADWRGTGLEFQLQTIDDRVLTFDAQTGELKKSEQMQACDETQNCSN